MKNILFVCVRTRAEVFANYHYGKGKIHASSAGIKLADKINPTVVEAMKEKNVAISAKVKPKMLPVQMSNDADLIVTMGCGAADVCPGPFFKETVDWGLEDPKDKPIEKVREIRDQIERRIIASLSKLTQPNVRHLKSDSK